MDKAKHTHVLGLVLVVGCHLPAAASDGFEPPREARVRRIATTDAGADCRGSDCSESEKPSESDPADEAKPAQPIKVRNVKAEAPKKPDMASIGITISIPASKVDCADVLLAVVGGGPAKLGSHAVLTAAWSGPVSNDESDDEPEPTLLWADSTDTELMTSLTVTGPTTAEVLCESLGVHDVRVELAPPAPCPATLHVQVECVEAKTP